MLFAGRTNLSAGIKWFTTSRWSHIGMVVRSHERLSPMLWESNRVAAVPDLLDRRHKSGVQLVDFGERIAVEKGPIAVRRLNRAVSRPMKVALEDLLEVLADRPYERNILELVRAAWDGPFGHIRSPNLSSVFCSELVAEAYQVMGLLTPHRLGGAPSNEYTPYDFSAAGRLRLVGGWALGAEQIIHSG